jgi:GT2 family glycosyltransferase
MLGFQETRTSNVLFRRKILDAADVPFRAEFGTGGEDVDFFRRMMEKGFTFVWCNEAVVYELVPQTRCTRSYLLRRALHRGNITFKFRGGHVRGLIKSFVAVPAYGLALPFLYIAGDHLFMKYMIKFCDHAGKLLALFGITPFKEYK